MRFSSETTTDGVVERHFTLGNVPGIVWSPTGPDHPRPLVLIAHGGGQNKQAPGVVARARRFVTLCGFAAAAIDAPGHGDRARTQADEQHVAGLRQRMAAGEPLGAYIAGFNAEVAARAVPEWQATLDALEDGGHAAGPVGFFGISMGAAIGLPLVAAEPRIGAAVLGLVGNDALLEVARKVTVPIEFLIQWDDEMLSRTDGLALFDALASAVKTLHANPGRHQDVPRFEVESGELFFRRHLTPA